MGAVENFAGVVFVTGGLTFVAMMAWSVLLTYEIYTQWQLIGPETERELHRQGMPYIDGPEEEQVFRFRHYERVTRELSSKKVRTDDRLATLIRRYQRARQVAVAAFISAFAALATLVIGRS